MARFPLRIPPLRRAWLAALLLAAASCGRPPGPPPAEEQEGIPSPFHRIPPEDLPRLLRDLAGPDAERAKESLVLSTPDAFPAFSRALAEGDETTVKAVLDCLADHLHPDAPALIRDLALSDADPWRRAAALEILHELAPSAGVDFLLPLGRLLAPGVPREAVVRTLRILEVQPAPPLTLRLLERAGDPDDEVRDLALRAVTSLAARHEESAVRIARDLGKTESDRVRLDIAKALARGSRPEGRAAVDLLLESGDPAVRREAARAVRERGRDRAPPRALARALADPDPGVSGEAFGFFREWGAKEDVAEIAPLLGAGGLDEARRRDLGALLDRIAGTEFGPDETKFRDWALRWMDGRIDPTPPASAVVAWAPPQEPDPLPARARVPWRNAAAAGLAACLAAAGIAAASLPRRRRSGGEEGGAGEPEIRTTAIGRVGKWIFDHRILVLLPWFLPPLLLFDGARLPEWPWRLALYGVLAIGAAVRVWCTGYRTWAYRSSGDRHLMTGGPYATVRHPIYVANFLLGIPLFLAVNLPALAFAFALWYAFTHFAIIAREDEILLAKYGEEFSRYASKIGRVIPRLRPYDQPSGAFSWEPIIKGMELPKAAAMLALLPLALEVFPRHLSSAAAWLRGLLGMV